MSFAGPVSAAAERFASGPAPKVSFEFFPPKTPEMEVKLWGAIEKLAPLAPDFVSVTYGAGGSTRERTHRAVSRILRETALKPAAHLTCVAASKAEVDAVARDYWAEGVRHIVALRGDPVDGIGAAYAPHPDGYAYASDLVAGLKAIGDFEVSVGVYPERHPESPSWDAELDNLKRKVDAGATRGVTQFFFDTDVFLRFVERARAAGITLPIVPGVMPVTNVKSLMRMAGMTGADVPRWLSDLFDGLDDDPGTRQLVAASVASEICSRLYQEGYDAFHFYTLNRAELTLAICRVLGLRPAAAAA